RLPVQLLGGQRHRGRHARGAPGERQGLHRADRLRYPPSLPPRAALMRVTAVGRSAFVTTIPGMCIPCRGEVWIEPVMHPTVRPYPPLRAKTTAFRPGDTARSGADRQTATSSA